MELCHIDTGFDTGWPSGVVLRAALSVVSIKAADPGARPSVHRNTTCWRWSFVSACLDGYALTRSMVDTHSIKTNNMTTHLCWRAL